MLTAFASAWAEGEITGLKVEMKDEAQNAIQILFTDAPQVAHDLENAQVVITADGIEAVTLNMADIKEMKFVNIDETITGIENLFPQKDKKAPKGIYTLSGQKVEKVQKGQVYIINGNKVLVK